MGDLWFHDIPNEILKGLLSLSKQFVPLKCDAKVFTESRKMSLGDYLITEILIKELELVERDSLLDQLIINSQHWPLPLSGWKHGPKGRNIYFKLDRTKFLNAVLSKSDMYLFGKSSLQSESEVTNPEIKANFIICDCSSSEPIGSDVKISSHSNLLTTRTLFHASLEQRLSSNSVLYITSKEGLIGMRGLVPSDVSHLEVDKLVSDCTEKKLREQFLNVLESSDNAEIGYIHGVSG